jgi:nitric oxide reductase subunit C
MAEKFTKSMARNIYYGGSFFFLLLLFGLTLDTVRQLPKRDHRENITTAVAHGKALWENNNCIGCHTLLGEGAYYAPELGNVFNRRGGGNEAAFKGFLNAWINAQPIDVPERRKMPQFNLTKKETDDLAEFLIWTSKINTNNWPPNIEG